ncbi:calcium-binding protein E63-1 isoform X2 [Uranotaenia lowii]|uniref:calcium-binding protein E63-1 isoform X2 n=1 Tax=Uranotaenia lowii TaxID=190385 RepID=UPI00247B0F45|nr:calcium-binding protein E63-1 isoform X2 [Uranotaenia lowii]
MFDESFGSESPERSPSPPPAQPGALRRVTDCNFLSARALRDGTPPKAAGGEYDPEEISVQREMGEGIHQMIASAEIEEQPKPTTKKRIIRRIVRKVKKKVGPKKDEKFYLRTAFDLLDRDQDGHVTPEELQFMLRNLGIHVRDELIDDLLREASRTGSGLIDETEFLQWVARIQAIKEESSNSSSSSSSSHGTTTAADDDLTQDLVAAFRVFDRDGNGYITRDELKSAMDMIGENVTEMQLNEMLELADADKDGRINYEEFARLLL